MNEKSVSDMRERMRKEWKILFDASIVATEAKDFDEWDRLDTLLRAVESVEKALVSYDEEKTK